MSSPSVPLAATTDRLDPRESNASHDVAIALRGVTRRFGTRAVLDSVDLSVRRGEFVSLLGPSGTGKTTLLRILAGLDSGFTGAATVESARSVMFQEPRLVAAKRVWQNVVIGHARSARANALAIRALQEVGLDRHAQMWPKTLSGGEAQRVALARALAVAPRLLLLDEPFAALDALTRIRMHDLVAQLWKRHGPTVLLVTHDVDEALLLSDRVIVLSEGRISFNAPIPLPRPRKRGERLFVELRDRLLTELGVLTTEAPVLAAI